MWGYTQLYCNWHILSKYLQPGYFRPQLHGSWQFVNQPLMPYIYLEYPQPQGLRAHGRWLLQKRYQRHFFQVVHEPWCHSLHRQALLGAGGSQLPQKLMVSVVIEVFFRAVDEESVENSILFCELCCVAGQHPVEIEQWRQGLSKQSGVTQATDQLQVHHRLHKRQPQVWPFQGQLRKRGPESIKDGQGLGSSRICTPL